ncbi:PDZ domain-containing protein [Treponema denticola]|uniref:PDZ domain-containing protein n=1 Tax=Treponema denticola TaxID=158 RepID=UPI0020A40BD6|nr:PDZ domain-containing protein [Treponema denticola]UTC95020.1 PDZ domain-containing protein [Treponema denticola]
MKRNRFLIYSLVLSVMFTSCVTTGFKDFYSPWYEENNFPPEAYLNEGETPIIIEVSDLNSKFREISSNWYWCIGYSGFNGAELDSSEINTALENLCKEKKAKIAIWSKAYTDTRNGVYSIPHTNYHSYINSYGYISSYTSTSYSTQSYSVRRYDFSSYLFVTIPDDYKLIYMPGFSATDLTEHDRELYKQNTGCLINIVYKNTAAYNANLFHGDIITNINGKKIYSTHDFFEYKKNSKIGDKWIMSIVRNGMEKKIELIFKLY